jgi:hypothetical protein
MIDLYRGWLVKAGAHVSPDAVIEISPLYELDAAELGNKLRGKELSIESDRYFGE